MNSRLETTGRLEGTIAQLEEDEELRILGEIEGVKGSESERRRCGIRTGESITRTQYCRLRGKWMAKEVVESPMSRTVGYEHIGHLVGRRMKMHACDWCEECRWLLGRSKLAATGG